MPGKEELGTMVVLPELVVVVVLPFGPVKVLEPERSIVLPD